MTSNLLSQSSFIFDHWQVFRFPNSGNFSRLFGVEGTNKHFEEPINIECGINDSEMEGVCGWV